MFLSPSFLVPKVCRSSSSPLTFNLSMMLTQLASYPLIPDMRGAVAIFSNIRISIYNEHAVGGRRQDRSAVENIPCI